MTTAPGRTRRTALANTAAAFAAATTAALTGAHAAAATASAENPRAEPRVRPVYRVTGNTVTMRPAPGSSRVLKTLHRGDTVVYYHSQGGGGAWHYVGHRGTDGWVLAQYLSRA